MRPKIRGCLNNSETRVEELGVELHVFHSYTKENCLLECRAAFMLKTCKCLAYFYPSLPLAFIKQYLPEYNSSKDITCNYNQLKCLSNLQYKMEEGIECKCPDNCNDIIYSQVINGLRKWVLHIPAQITQKSH